MCCMPREEVGLKGARAAEAEKEQMPLTPAQSSSLSFRSHPSRLGMVAW